MKLGQEDFHYKTQKFIEQSQKQWKIRLNKIK